MYKIKIWQARSPTAMLLRHRQHPYISAHILYAAHNAGMPNLYVPGVHAQPPEGSAVAADNESAGHCAKLLPCQPLPLPAAGAGAGAAPEGMDGPLPVALVAGACKSCLKVPCAVLGSGPLAVLWALAKVACSMLTMLTWGRDSDHAHAHVHAANAAITIARRSTRLGRLLGLAGRADSGPSVDLVLVRVGWPLSALMRSLLLLFMFKFPVWLRLLTGL